MSKRCSKCKCTKPPTEYNKDSGTPDGLYGWCKSCRRMKYTTITELERKNRKRNASEARAMRNAHRRHRYAVDSSYRIECSLRVSFKRSIKRGSVSHLKDYIGCSIPDLRARIQSMWEPGMTWDNYGKWHIDHIKPLASFDLTDRSQIGIAWHHTNLQPLWARDNLVKGILYGT